MSDRRDEIEDENGGGGGHAIEGYNYQIDVSVWLALDLVLAAKLTQEVVLEPASEEDLEARLETYEPGRVTTAAPMDGYTLVVQAKLRSGDAWTVPRIKALLEHGGIRRPSASARLAAPGVRYLLVTSAGLNGRTRDLKVRHAGVWPNPAKMPPVIARALPTGARGRVAVIGNQDQERLATDIEKLLTESFRVPHARWNACLRKLREEARSRINSGSSRRWRRDEIERVIRDHEGCIVSSPELEHYVHPTNWSDLRSLMRERGAALIIGQSGTGKTLATRKLYEELRREIPGLSRVPIKLGPQQLRDDETASPVLYDIEDPWGRFDFDPASRPWNDQLAQLFARARHDRLIVATSRLDVARTSGALQSVKPWLVALEAEHYGRRERIRLYRSRIDGLPRELLSVAAQAEPKVLSELATPLEIQKYFDALRVIDREKLKNPPAFVSEAIDRAHQDSIERTVIEQIEHRQDVRAAAIIWGLLKVADKLSLGVLRPIEEGLADREPAMREGVTPLVNFFVAARNLRQNETTVTYYHPRVEAGIEQALGKHELVARRTIRLLMELLVAPDGPSEEWGTAASARLLAAAQRKPALKPSPPAAAVAKIDAWLAARLAEGGREFKANLQLAAAAGSSNSNASELARYLLSRPDPTFDGMMMSWGPLEKDNAWYARLRGDPSTRALVETFIREVLPTEHDHYPISFVADVEQLAPDLSQAFLAAAAKAVHFGFIHSDETIAEGALRDLDGFETIVDAAIEVLTPSEEERKTNAETHLAIINGEYSPDYAEHVADSDDGYTAQEFLGAYVERVRATKGWRHLAQHRRLDGLLYYWLRSLAKAAERPAADAEEIAGAFAAGQGSAHEDDLWFVLQRAWDPRYQPALAARLLEGRADRAVLRAALSCVVEHAPGELAAVGRELSERAEWGRLVEIVLDLSDMRSTSGDDAPREAAAAAALGSLPAPLPELGEASLLLTKNQAVSVSEEARVLLEELGAGSEDVRRFRVAVDAHMTLPVGDDIGWLLAHSEDVDCAVEAVEAAIRRDMKAEVEGALEHKFAQVKARALSALGGPMAPPLPDRLLAKAADRGSPVRRALVALLDAKPHAAHLPTLLRLAGDRWSRSSTFYGEEEDLPIARSAVDAIGKLPKLAADEVDHLYAIGIDTSDQGLRLSIFRLLARTSGLAVQERLFELSVTPGRVPVRHAAAVALLQAREAVALEVVQRITPDLLATRVEPVAANLAVLFALRADVNTVLRAAEALSTNAKRRVLLLLLIWIMRNRDDAATRTLASMLPADHPGVAWAMGAGLQDADDAMLADLGDPGTCAQVLRWMKPRA